MRNPAVEPEALDTDPDATEERIAKRKPSESNDSPVRPPGVDADTQTPAGSAEWSSFDLRRSLRLLHSTNEGVVKRTLRRLHIRFWHAAAARLTQILRLAGAPRSALVLIKDIVDT